jgi:hypothetical protein
LIGLSCNPKRRQFAIRQASGFQRDPQAASSDLFSDHLQGFRSPRIMMCHAVQSEFALVSALIEVGSRSFTPRDGDYCAESRNRALPGTLKE